MPTALGEVAGGIINGKMYVVGDGSSNTLRYDFSSKSWSSSLAKRPYPAKDQTSDVVNGKLYVFGGIKYANGLRNIYNYVQIYDPATNKWTMGKPMPFPAGVHTSSVRIDIASGVPMREKLRFIWA